jgi:ABC-2 type transport system permease protein
MMLAPMLLAKLSPVKPLKIAILDETQAIYRSLDDSLTSDPEDDFIKPKGKTRGAPEAPKVRRFQLEAAPEEGGKDAVLAALSRRIDDESLDAYIVIPADILSGTSEPTYYGRTVSDLWALRRIERAMSEVMISRRLSGEGVDPAKVKDLTRRVDLQTIKLGQKGEKSKSGFAEEWIATMSFVMLLYMNLILYGSGLARSLIEEKTNRVIEVLLSSVTSFQLMMGKILGIGAAGLTQFVIWSLAALGFSRMQAPGGPGGEGAGFQIDPAVLGYFVLYFLLGYFLYAALFCIVGAICTTEQEAQAAQQPVVMLLVVPILVALSVVRQPASTVAVAMSHVPFFSPIIMFMRIQLLTPPMWEILVNVAALLATIAGVVWVSSRVFRVGILMTGKRATIPEIVRWVRAS